MVVEIHGTGSNNRGAELMAIAIAERLRRSMPNIRLVVPHSFGDFEQRARYGFWTTWEVPGRVRGLVKTLILRAAAAAAPGQTGFIDPVAIDAVLDASGFAFGDVWGPQNAHRLLKRMSSRGRAGKPLVLLPQAFGPFRQKETAEAMRLLAARATLIFARDPESKEHLTMAGVPLTKIRTSPDFTVEVRGIVPEDLELAAEFVAIVPNTRMTDKTDRGNAYLEFLGRVVTRLRELKLLPVFVLHEAREDRILIEHLAESGVDAPVISHQDPRVLKGILGRAQFVVGSRFHALVGALSQGVPCLGVGWSHKYPKLFADFGCEEFLIGDCGSTQRVDRVLDELADPRMRERCRGNLLVAAEQVRAATEAMWHEVLGVLGIPSTPDARRG